MHVSAIRMGVLAASVVCALPATAWEGCGTVPRTVVALYDGAREGAARDTRIHRHAELVLDHLGYVLVYADVAHPEGLPPPDALAAGSRIAAVLSWFDAPVPEPAALSAWIDEIPARCGARPRTMILGDPGVLSAGAAAEGHLARAGIAVLGGDVTLGVTATTTRTGPIAIDAEADFILPPGRYAHIGAIPAARALLTAEKDMVRIDLAAIGPDGAYAHGAALVVEDARGAAFWHLDPFAFFDAGFDAGTAPVPDVTTSNGRRLFFATVDGTGWSDLLPSRQFGDAPEVAGEVVTDRLVAPFPEVPVTVALATGDLKAGPGRMTADRGRAAAARLATMPHVELGTLGRSLVRRWAAFAPGADLGTTAAATGPTGPEGFVPTAVERLGGLIAGPRAAPDADRRHADAPFDLGSEIGGAAAEVAALASAQAPAVFMWSGDARPFVEAVAAADAAGLPSLGGGGGAIRALAPSLTSLTPPTAPVGGEVQVLSALGDERAHGGAAPAPGHRGLRLTWAWTGSPRRLKPAHLAYTADAALTFADRTAVAEAMEAARGPAYRRVTARSYVAAVRGARTMRAVAEGSLAWRIEERGALQTVRFDDARALSLDVGASAGVLGARRHGDALYVALDPAAVTPRVALARDAAPSGAVHPEGAPALADTGFDLSALSRDGCRLRVDIAGRPPGQVAWWARPGAPLTVTLSRGGVVHTRAIATADAAGRAVIDVVELPGGLAELVVSTPCAGDE